MDCPTCDGTGLVTRTSSTLQDDMACRTCAGTGKVRTPKGLKRLKKDLRATRTTVLFENGAVIRWIYRGRYVYTAVFVADRDRWYVSGVGTAFLNSGVTYDTLVTYLTRSDVTDVVVASSWAPVA